MNQSLLLRPAPGLVVRDPATRKALPPEGAAVADTTYWHRRLAEGSVHLVPDPTPATKKAATQRNAQ